MITITHRFIRNFSKNCVKLAGHSKWANIRHIKALKDGEKSTSFNKLSRQIRIAIQEGKSPNPAINSLLRTTIDDAVKKKMPISTIKNILKKYNDTNAAQLKHYTLEIKVLNKIYLIAVMYTDNINHQKHLVSTLLKKIGGSFTDCKHLFESAGFIICKLENSNLKIDDFEEFCMTSAIHCGAEEYDVIEGSIKNAVFTCAPLEMDRVRQSLQKENWYIENYEIVYNPIIPANVDDTVLAAYTAFKEKLKNIEGVEEIFDNLNNEA